jgi:hypothetical protein
MSILHLDVRKGKRASLLIRGGRGKGIPRLEQMLAMSSRCMKGIDTTLLNGMNTLLGDLVPNCLMTCRGYTGWPVHDYTILGVGLMPTTWLSLTCAYRLALPDLSCNCSGGGKDANGMVAGASSQMFTPWPASGMPFNGWAGETTSVHPWQQNWGQLPTSSGANSAQPYLMLPTMNTGAGGSGLSGSS